MTEVANTPSSPNHRPRGATDPEASAAARKAADTAQRVGEAAAPVVAQLTDPTLSASGPSGASGGSAASSPDPFAPEACIVDPKLIGSRRIHIAIARRKPGPLEWFRLHPGEEYYRGPLGLVTVQNAEGIGATYFTTPAMASLLPPGTCKPHYLGLAVTSTGAIFIPEIKMPDPNRANVWTDSAKAVYDKALTGWVCMESSARLGAQISQPLVQVVGVFACFQKGALGETGAGRLRGCAHGR